MIDLSEFSEDELVAEIERRKRGAKPKMRSLGLINGVMAIDMTKLREVCQKYIDYVDSDDYLRRDDIWENNVYEAAIETFFGKGVWDWINKRDE